MLKNASTYHMMLLFSLDINRSADSESTEQPDKKKKEQLSSKAKRSQWVPVSKKPGQTKTRTKPAVHVTVESTSSTSPSDEQVRNLMIKGKTALKGRTVRDPKDDETFLVSELSLFFKFQFLEPLTNKIE